MAKIADTVPERLRPFVLEPASRARPGWRREPDRIDMARTRAHIHEGKKIALCYRDEHGRDSERTIWPIAIGYLEAVRMMAAWCELRKDFRSFRTDRVVDAVYLDEKYPERRDAAAGEMAAEPGLGAAERRLMADGGGWPPRHSALETAWQQDQPLMPKAPARPAAPAAPIRRTGRASPPRTTRRSTCIPEKFVNDRLSGMRCDGDRCSALSGRIGVATSCGIYSDAAGSLPDLHARRCRMRHGAAQAWVAGFG